MDKIEETILARYEMKESGAFYDRLKKVVVKERPKDVIKINHPKSGYISEKRQRIINDLRSRSGVFPLDFPEA